MHRLQLFLLLLASSGLAEPLVAQIPTPITYGDGRRAQATREELQATLLEIEKIVSSPGYSARLRDARRREAELIRERLEVGDLQVGDAISLTVLGEPQFTSPAGGLLIGPGRVLSLPGLPDIPMSGVLRSEAQQHLTEALSKQLRDPQVQVQTNIRLTFTGAVARAGYYQVPADIMPTDAIMTVAGGFGGGAEPNRTIIRRQGREIWSREAFQDALLRGMTLDQLNLRTNDEIFVHATGQTSWQTIVGVLGAASSLTFIFFRVFR